MIENQCLWNLSSHSDTSEHCNIMLKSLTQIHDHRLQMDTHQGPATSPYFLSIYFFAISKMSMGQLLSPQQVLSLVPFLFQWMVLLYISLRNMEIMWHIIPFLITTNQATCIHSFFAYCLLVTMSRLSQFLSKTHPHSSIGLTSQRLGSR